MNQGEKSDAARKEEEILAFWEWERVFEKSLEKAAPKGDFVFYEGPPTANGKPGVHHLESRAFKDAIPRYKTMQGYRVARRAGWDTHGLPVELEVEKELNFSGKKDIEHYGIAAFNKKCRESVLRYIDLWERFTKRIGYWVDDTKAYFTFDASYMEVLWHLVAHIHKDERLYKDYKVVPWCPRCGTSLSSHELAQGYEDVKDLSVTVKFELDGHPNTYFLAWTTTPWTLPGNVALAVGENITYVKARILPQAQIQKAGTGTYVVQKNEYVFLAKDILERNERTLSGFLMGNGQELAIEEEIKGASLVGKVYKPLYPYARELASESEKAKFEKAFKVYAADFVTTEDGTGIVHTAVMYGQEDFELGTRVGLPKVHLVAPDGRFRDGTGVLTGREATDEATAVEIVKDLAGRGLLFAKEKHEHPYPFCWRCKSRLIYYARDSWYIRMSDLRDTLVAENASVHWEPGYIKEGRMGEWLAGAKDWAISRERYWGTPLPVWRNADGSEQLVIGSVEELKDRAKKSSNRYFLMRHGEAQSNVQMRVNALPDDSNTLTDTGRAQILHTAQELKNLGVDYIYTSPLLRARESAAFLADAFGLAPERVIEEPRLSENNFGLLEGHGIREYESLYPRSLDKLTTTPEGAESWRAVRQRITGALYDIEHAHTQAKIVVISHEGPLQMLECGARAYSDEESARAIADNRFRFHTGAWRELVFTPLPHNEEYELDLHRPYIDEVVLVGANGGELRRVPEVMDVWFDSGAMPFAQYAKERGQESLAHFVQHVPYPADYISEAIDQTRGWFYTLLAVGVLMGRGAPYKNVISLGHLLDEAGQKMSKSKGNVLDPWVEIDRWGVDTLRLWMYSVTGAGDAKNYGDRSVREASRAIAWLKNCAAFYTLCATGAGEAQEERKTHVLDRWMRARLARAREEITEGLETYELLSASRALVALLEDLSQWYVRRVRDRARAGEQEALRTLREALRVCALLAAPLTPFVAEEVWQVVREESDPVSVHLAPWPHESLFTQATHALGLDGEEALLEGMARVRALATEVRELRQKAGIKVRQPLATLSVTLELTGDLAALLAEEVNVKQVLVGQVRTELDTALTPELVREGDEREMARAVAEARKSEGLAPREEARVERTADGKYAVDLSTGPVRFSLVRGLPEADSKDAV